MCESFNSSILDARTKGLITMCEMIRTKLMKRIHTRRDKMRKYQSVYCPKILKKLEKNKKVSWFYRSEWSGGEKYQVSGQDGQFVVDTQCRTCSCRRWDLTGIPCGHAISALYYNNNNPVDYIDDCYKVSTYLKTYSHLIYPTTGKDLWPKSNMPPIIPNELPKQKQGRRRTMRRKEADEGPSGTKNGIVHGKVSKNGIVMHCSICGSAKHNKRFHGKQENEATQSIAKKTVMKEKSIGQSGGLESISIPHTMQWMPDGTTRYPNTSRANVSIPSKKSQVITSSSEDSTHCSLHVYEGADQDLAKSTKQVQNVNKGKTNLKDSSAKKRKIWVPPSYSYGDASFPEWNW